MLFSVKDVCVLYLPALSFTCEDYDKYRAHPWNPVPLRRAHPGPGPRTVAFPRYAYEVLFSGKDVVVGRGSVLGEKCEERSATSCHLVQSLMLGAAWYKDTAHENVPPPEPP